MLLIVVGEVLGEGVGESLGAARVGDGAGGEVVAAGDFFVPGDFDEVDGFGFAGLEADGGPGGNVETEAVGAGAVEAEGGVGLDEMIMAADLDGAVAEVGDGEDGGGAARVEDDLAGSGSQKAGFGIGRGWAKELKIGDGEKTAVEGEGQVAIFGGNGVVDGDEFGAVGEGAFDLDFGDEPGDAGHDLVAAEEAFAEVHELCDGPAIADVFEELGGDEGDGFGLVEAEAAGETLLGEEPGVVEEELVDFTGA